MKQRGKEKNELKEMRTTSETSEVKRPNIQIIEVPEEEDKKKDHEKYLRR